MAYWFNVDSRVVETDETRSPGAFCLGPYGTFDEAARALETAHEKSESWDEADKEWDERGASWSPDPES